MALLSRKLRHFRRRGSRSRAHDVCGPSRRGGDIARRNPIPVNGYLVQRFIAALHTASTRCQSQSGRYEESLLDRRQRMIIFSRRCRRLGFENNEDTRYLSCDELLISSYLVLSRLISSYCYRAGAWSATRRLRTPPTLYTMASLLFYRRLHARSDVVFVSCELNSACVTPGSW